MGHHCLVLRIGPATNKIKFAFEHRFWIWAGNVEFSFLNIIGRVRPQKYLVKPLPTRLHKKCGEIVKQNQKVKGKLLEEKKNCYIMELVCIKDVNF